MKRLLSATATMILSLATMVLTATTERPMLVRVDLHDGSTLQKISENGFDIAFVAPRDHAEIVADDNDFSRLQSLGVNPRIIHEDLIAFYQSRYPLETTMGGFRTYSEALSFMDSLHQQYPSITTARASIGHSYENRGLWMLKISDNPDLDEDEPELFINALMHSNEPMSLEASLRYMEYLCQNYGTDSMVTELVNNREFYFVPITNPDGYEYNYQTNPNGGGMWRKNRHDQGVDLNRNWGYMWGFDNMGSSPDPNHPWYRGSGPFSEPETQRLREFIDARHFKIILNLHSFGGYFVYPWGYALEHTVDQSLLSVISDSATAQNQFSTGTVWELRYRCNGYADDWQYGEQVEKPKMLAFLMEMGNSTDGFWPPILRIPILWDQCLPTLLFLSRIADNPYMAGVPPVPILNPIGDVSGDSFVVSWQSNDTLNPAVSYELKEMTGFQRMTDSFETDASNWILNGFTRGTTHVHSGTYSLYSGSQNNYEAAAMLTNRVTVASDDTLKFWTWYNIEADYDFAYVQISTDGGVIFENLAGNITTNNNPYYRNMGNGITGFRNWTLAKFPLVAYAGQSVQLRIRYSTDQSIYLEGFYADEFYPVETFQNQNILDSNIPDSFFVVTGHAVGDYYYQVRGQDSQDQWSALSNRVVALVLSPPCNYIVGDVNGIGGFNGLDVVYAVAYLKGGLPPLYSCECTLGNTWYVSGDVNGSCSFNGLDVTYMVAYLKGGPIPVPCPDCPPAGIFTTAKDKQIEIRPGISK